MFKKAMIRIIGKLANLYPSHVFYARDYMPDLIFSTDRKTHEKITQTALICICVAASKVLKSGDVCTSTFTGVTDKGEDVGDYEIIIHRVK